MDANAQPQAAQLPEKSTRRTTVEHLISAINFECQLGYPVKYVPQHQIESPPFIIWDCLKLFCLDMNLLSPIYIVHAL